MDKIAGSWDVGPHIALPVEPTWEEFVRLNGGCRVSSLVSASPIFENADFIFEQAGVVLELKEVQTEFSRSPAFLKGLSKLVGRLTAENPAWRPELLGGNGQYPSWFHAEFLRLFRPLVSRILKKANRQLRETKDHFGIKSATGVLLFVNDGFTSIEPRLIQGVAGNLLVTSYSSIDCFLYLGVNRYIVVPGNVTPCLLWSPMYSDRADNTLVSFIDNLGQKWAQFLESKIGPFTVMQETSDRDLLRGARSLVLPDEGCR